MSGLIEYRAKLRDEGGPVFAGSDSRRENRERRGRIMPGGFVPSKCCFKAFIVGASEQVVRHVLRERCDVKQGCPTVDLGFAGEHIVRGQQRGQRGMLVGLELQRLGGAEIGVDARQHLGEPNHKA